MSWALWILDILGRAWGWYKKVFTNDKPVEKAVTHEQPKVPVSDGKTEAERWKELGL